MRGRNGIRVNSKPYPGYTVGNLHWTHPNSPYQRIQDREKQTVVLYGNPDVIGFDKARARYVRAMQQKE